MPPPDTPAARLLLLRLAAADKRPPTLAKTRADLAPLLDPAPNADGWADLVADLRAAGLVAEPERKLTAKGKPGKPSAALVPTDAGRERAAATVGADRLHGLTWPHIQARYLVPLALGGSPGPALKADAVRARALKRRHRLPVATRDTVAAALEALACRELGFPDCVTLKEVLPRLLARTADIPKPPAKKKQFDALAVRKLLGLSTGSKTELPHALIRAWAAAHAPAADPPALDLPAFAAAVLAAARGSETGRFGDDTVLVNHVHRAYLAAGHPGLSLDDFKGRLLEATAARLLNLDRADEPTLLPDGDAKASEIKHLHTTFHLVRTKD